MKKKAGRTIANKRAFEADTILTLLQLVMFVVMTIWLILFTSQAKPARAEKISLTVLSEKYPDERNLLYYTDDNGYALTDLMGRELLMGGNITLQGDYRTILQDSYPNVFESPLYGVSNSHKTCPYPNPLPVGYDSDYNVSHVNISDYVHCYAIPKKIGSLFSYPINLSKTYELAQAGPPTNMIVSAWSEGGKIKYSCSNNKGYYWATPSEISGSDDGYLPLVTNDATDLFLIWIKVYSDDYAEIAYAKTALSTISCPLAWSGITLLNKVQLCYGASPLINACSNTKVGEYWNNVRLYVDTCSGCTKYNKLKAEYSYSNLPSIFKENRNITYYLSRIEPRYRIDLSYDDGTAKAETTYGSEKLGGPVRESAPVEFAPPAGFMGAIQMRLQTQ